jgi:hydroxymethylbilane synthase
MPTGASGPLRLGTRGSELALWQARETARLVGVPVEVVIVKTEGDRRRDIALQGQSMTGFFTKDIERRLLDLEIDLAVHSLKDLPTRSDPDLEVVAVLPRAPVDDLVLVHPHWLDEAAAIPVRRGCAVGAGSLRRQALLRLWAPWARPEPIRGNVPTRVRKCVDGELGAVVLARAGVERLELDVAPLRAFRIDPARWLPAPAQGAVAVQARRGDERARAAAAPVDDEPTRLAVSLERHLLAAFEGGCHTAFGAYARRDGAAWRVDLGLDRGDEGWGQLTVRGALAECGAVGRESLARFAAPVATGGAPLASPWSLGADAQRD